MVNVSCKLVYRFLNGTMAITGTYVHSIEFLISINYLTEGVII